VFEKMRTTKKGEEGVILHYTTSTIDELTHITELLF
jgi:hypothetical protein